MSTKNTRIQINTHTKNKYLIKFGYYSGLQKHPQIKNVVCDKCLFFGKKLLYIIANRGTHYSIFLYKHNESITEIGYNYLNHCIFISYYSKPHVPNINNIIPVDCADYNRLYGKTYWIHAHYRFDINDNIYEMHYVDRVGNLIHKFYT